mgnify:CR=1 FL=1
MKTSKLILTAGLSMAAMLSLSSCQKEDNNSTTPSGETKVLTLASSSVEVKAGETATVEITSGNGDYDVVPADKGIATATVSGTTITVTGVKSGSTIITVSDGAKQAKPLQVKVTKSGSNPIPTDVLYTLEIFSNETGELPYWKPSVGPKTISNTYIASVLDVKNNTMNAAQYAVQDAVKEFINDPTIGDDVIILGGYTGEGNTADYGYSSPAVLITNNDDAAHPGCKVVTVIATCLSGYLGWEDGKYISRPGTAWYDPSDGSITLENCYGELCWKDGQWKFTYNRKYTPVK